MIPLANETAGGCLIDRCGSNRRIIHHRLDAKQSKANVSIRIVLLISSAMMEYVRSGDWTRNLVRTAADKQINLVLANNKVEPE